MTPDLYINSNATGAGDGLSWINAYTTVSAAETDALNPMAAGMKIGVHYTSIPNETISPVDIPARVEFYSLDSSNNYLKGAEIGQTSEALMQFRPPLNSYCSFTGIYLASTDGMSFYYQDTQTNIVDGGISLTRLGVDIFAISSSDGTVVKLKECEFYAANAGSYIQLQNGSSVLINGMTFEVGSVLLTQAFRVIGYGGSSWKIHNTDLSLMCAPSLPLFGDININADRVSIDISRCKMPTGFSVVGAASTEINLSYKLISCDTGSGYHYFEYFDAITGVSQEDTTNYLTATWDKADTQGFSALLSSSNASISNPLRHKLVEIPAQDITSDVTYKVNFSSANTLTDTQFWLEVVYPDGTSQALGVVGSTRPADILATGTLHTTNAESWTGAGANKYEDSITITGMAGVDNGNVEIWVNLAEPSIDVWACPLLIIT